MPSGVSNSHVAQLNIGALLACLEDASMTDFRNGLGPVNAAGEAAPGFVWRLQSDDGDATSLSVSDNPLHIINLTVWESIESLRDFVFAGIHRDFLRRRNEWFGDDGRRTAVWRIPIGTLPTVQDAIDRADFLDVYGESPYAYSSLGTRASVRPELIIDEQSLTAPESIELIDELNADLSNGEAEDEVHFFGLTPEQVAPGMGQFLVARLDGVTVGCGAFRMIGNGTAEIKRMYVRPSARGHKIGAAILHELQARAVRCGADRLALETAVRLTEAMGLYTKAGFAPCACWGDYADSPSSACFEKRLPHSDAPAVS